MGYSSYNTRSRSVLKTASTTRSSFSNEQIFSDRLDPLLDPRRFDFRESNSSENHPNPTPIMIGLDVTGSMGFIANKVAKIGLKKSFEHIIDNNIFKSPHLMYMAIGDSRTDNAPIQATQFESDHTLLNQIDKLYIEGYGGGNGSESYHLAWMFAKYKAKIDVDCNKGYIFTIGDEPLAESTNGNDYSFLGVTRPEKDESLKALYEEMSQYFNIYHLVVEEGHHCIYNGSDSVLRSTQGIMPRNNVILLKNSDYISEVISAIMQLNNNVSIENILMSYPVKSHDTIKYALQMN